MLNDLDPAGVAMRKRGAIRRRVYYSAGPNECCAMMATTNYPNGIYTFMAVGTLLAENGYGWKLVGLQKILEFCAVIS